MAKKNPLARRSRPRRGDDQPLPTTAEEILARPRPSSVLKALLPVGQRPPRLAEIAERLTAAGLPFECVGHSEAGCAAPWTANIALPSDGDEPTSTTLSLRRSPPGASARGDWSGLTAEERQAVRRSRWALTLSSRFAEHPLDAYHQQLRILAAAAPQAVAVFDENALRGRSGTWLRDVASTGVPPAPASLFSIHAVRDPRRAEGRVWLHTHGLARCGTIELEILGVPKEHTVAMGTFINHAASLFMDLGEPLEGELVELGAGLPVLWLSWAFASLHCRGELGASPRDRDRAHEGARGVLFAPRLGEGELRSLVEYVPALERDTPLFVSRLETERQELLARERLPRFARLHERCGRRPGWRFFVKLGYEMDDAHCECEREQLWFEVHAVAGDEVEATLRSSPHRIGGMREGQRGRHALSRLTGWSISCEHGDFGPGSVANLERQVGRSDA